MTAARRLAAILAVDVAGYSRLMGEDERGTARAAPNRRFVRRGEYARGTGRRAHWGIARAIDSIGVPL
jgi:class 3 adenylate cyclase